MTPIRPSVLPPTPRGAQAPESGKQAAQRAFFAAALGQAQTPVPQAPAQPVPTAVNRASAAEAPQKILRPGSLIDIRV